MVSTIIKVETIDYYHRDKNMKVTCGLLPKKLNSNRKYFDDPTLPVPKINLNVNVPDSGAGELQMESLLEYIRQKRWPNGQKPDFVTNKQLLKCIASGDYDEMSVEVFRMDGVIFMLKSSQSWTHVPNFGTVFEHFLTRKSEDEAIDKDGLVEKAVFIAEIPLEKGAVKVMYSGEIDAIDDNKQHYEFKVLSGGLNDYFWKNRSCSYYWQSILSNVPTIIVGTRTGKPLNDPLTRPPMSLPPHSLIKIETLDVASMPGKVNPSGKYDKNYWKVNSCEERLKKFLSLAYLIRDKERYHFSKAMADLQWKVERIEGRTSSFEKVVFNCLKAPIFCRSSVQPSSVETTEAPSSTASITPLVKVSSIQKVKSSNFSSPAYVVTFDATPINSKCITSTATIGTQTQSKEDLEPSLTPSLAIPPAAILPQLDHSKVLAEILTTPKTKIVFNVLYNEPLTARIGLHNDTNTPIAFRISDHHSDITITPTVGGLVTGIWVYLDISVKGGCQDLKALEEYPIVMEWTNLPSDAECDETSLRKLFRLDGLFRRKAINVEFNE